MINHKSKSLIEFKDMYETPSYLYNYLNELRGFDVDLAADSNNHQHPVYLTESLNTPWRLYGTEGFCNPPYSNIPPWITKAILEQSRGFTTTMLIPSFNGDLYYGDVLESASEIIQIIGRISFISPCTYLVGTSSGFKLIKKGDLVKGNTRGSMVAIFGTSKDNCKYSHIYRDDIMKRYKT